MTSTFQKIPTSCREAVPRKWEQGWEEKLKVKITLLPEIMFEKKGYSHVGGLNKSQYKKGFERMLNAAKQYWKIP